MEDWNDPERVEKFAGRDADHRLVQLVERYERPEQVRVLDLGCAGGRNAEFLARRGFDVWAVDRATAMVARTRDRVAEWLGDTEARRRVLEGEMADLSVVPVSAFHLVVALGIYHQAESEAEWAKALAETARVVVPGGLCLVSAFAPGTAFDGKVLERVPGSSLCHRQADGTVMSLRDPEALDRDFHALGFYPEVPSEVVVREADDMIRVTVNALYGKRRAA